MGEKASFCNIELHMTKGSAKGRFEFAGNGLFFVEVLGVIFKELDVIWYDNATQAAIFAEALNIAEQIAEGEESDGEGD